MSTIYLHIGTPKTGTTAIQNFCGNNATALHQAGYSFPDFGFRFLGIGVNRNAHFMVQRMYTTGKKRDRQGEKELQQKGWSFLQKELKKYSCVILSDENIWSNREFDTKRWQEYQKQAAKMGAQLKVVVYLRRQDQVIQSYWAQRVKEDVTDTFDEYIASGRFRRFRVDYLQRLQEIADGIGQDHVLVRVYEKEQYQGGTIVSDFLHTIGIEEESSFHNPEAQYNPSISGSYLELKRRMNHNPAYCGKQNFMMELLMQAQGVSGSYDKVTYFTDEEQQSFLKAYAEDNRQVANVYLHREGELFTEILTNPGRGYSQTSEGELLSICEEVILLQHQQMEEQKRKQGRLGYLLKQVLKCLVRR